jgi:SAM-dependent methyltransferase
MESGDEAVRLEMKTDASVVETQARRAGLVSGMRTADMFCGAGVTTAILSGIAAPAGTVGVDGSEERILHAREKHSGPRRSFVHRDIRSDLTDLGEFDFVWVRFALEYFREEAFSIVQNLSSVVKPGGILCLIDLDHNCLNHFGLPGRLENAIRVSIAQLEEKADFDPYAGRKLYSHLYRLGYRDIRADAGAHHLIYGPLRDSDAYNWVKKIEVISRKIRIDIPGYASAEEFLEDFKRHFSEPGRFTYTPVISCWGRRAPA